MTDEVTKNLGGRPKGTRTKYKNSMPARALDILAEGGLLCHVAAGLGVDRDTVSAWRRDPRKKRFQEAITKGLSLSEVVHADRLMMIARDGRGNVSAQLRIMEWGFGWKDVKTIENIDDKQKLTQEELDAKIAALAGNPGDPKVVKFR